MVYDGTNELVYLDSALVGCTPWTQSAYAPSYKYQFGTGFTSGWPAGNGGWYSFNGVIDEPSLYDRALSSNEVTAIYAAGSAGKGIEIQTTNATPGNFSLRFPTAANQGYTIQQKTDLAATNWLSCTNFVGDGSIYRFIAPTTTNKALFFRVHAP